MRNLQSYAQIIVVMGGFSAEREISMLSGEAVYQSLCRNHKNVKKVVVDHDIIRPVLDAVDEEKNSFVFIALHGRGGEDGTIQGALSAANIPFSGSSIQASSIAMDKEKTKWLLQQNQLPTPQSKTIHQEFELSESNLENLFIEMGPELFVKPVSEGSSVGMSKVSTTAELVSALEQAFQYDSKVLVEHCIDGSEYTVAILGKESLPSIRLETPREFYDYKAKYQTHSTQYHCPSGLTAAEEKELGDLCLHAFNIVGCSVWGRVDVLRDKKLGWQLLEVNTVPGMTEKSLVPMAAKESGLSFDQLVTTICNFSMNQVNNEASNE